MDRGLLLALGLLVPGPAAAAPAARAAPRAVAFAVPAKVGAFAPQALAPSAAVPALAVPAAPPALAAPAALPTAPAAEAALSYQGALPVDAPRLNLRVAELKAAFGTRDAGAVAEAPAAASSANLARAKSPERPAPRSAVLPVLPAAPAPQGRLARLAARFLRVFFPPVLVSGCLLGLHVRYDGKDLKAVARLRKLFAQGRVVTICPEVEGGLMVPREPAHIVGGTGADVLDGRARVVTSSGRDVTDAFLRGAYAALAKAKAAGCREAYLKTRSPSCGVGMGVAAALLERHGIKVIGTDAARA